MEFIKSIGQYNKAFVPLIVMGFAMLNNLTGFNFGVGETEANLIMGFLGLVMSWLVYLIPNTQKVVTPIVVPAVVPAVVTTVEEVAKPSILRTAKD